MRAFRFRDIFNTKTGLKVTDQLVLKVTGDGRLPDRSYQGDAGLDVYSAFNYVVPPHEFMDIDCGIKIEMPEGVWAMLTGRSSTIRKRGLLVNTAIIDSGYRGPIFAGVQNLRSEGHLVHVGDRLAQLILFHNLTERVIVAQVDKLSESHRGESGFGSSGQ